MLAIVLAAAVAASLAAPPPPADLKTPPADAQKSADGLLTKQLAPGTSSEHTSSEHPSAADFIHFHYAVWKGSNGSVVDYTRGSASSFIEMAKLLPGMREMFEQMTPGEQRRAWIPSSLGGGKIAEGETFVVEGQLVDIVHPPVAPADVAAPPADATKTSSGLAYKIRRPGTGARRPARRNTVTVDYGGWTTEGQMFDSSIIRGEPAEFRLDEVIPGWTEGLELMTEGEQVRFWIPERLAYKGRSDKPKGMLVFDVELVKVK
jgi:peptidylprolyl isomerase